MTEVRVPTWRLEDRLRRSADEAGVGVSEMADYLEVSRTSVSNWINGRVRPDTRTLRVWAMRCGVPFEWLRDGDSALNRDTPAARETPGLRITVLAAA